MYFTIEHYEPSKVGDDQLDFHNTKEGVLDKVDTDGIDRVDKVDASITVPIYNIELSIHQGESALEDLIASEKVDDSILDRAGFVFEEDDTIHVWFMDDVQLSVVVHECVHIVNFIYSIIHSQKDLINDEHEAYLTAWLFDEIISKIKTT